MKLRWLQLSDIHFNFNNYETVRVRNETLKYLNGQKFDFIVITGDIAYKGKGYGQEVLVFINSIRNSCLENPDNLFIVPGNHDLKRSQLRTNIINGIKLNEDTSHFVADRMDKETYETLIKAFDDFFGFYKDVTGREYPKDRLHFVEKRKYFNIIHINTCLMSGIDKEEGKLVFNQGKLYETLKENMIKDSKSLNIVIGHHTLECLGSDEQKLFQKNLSDFNIDIYLSGHVHVPSFKFHQNLNNDIHMVSCGADVVDGHASAGLIIGNTDLDNGNTSVEFYKWSYENQRWVIDNGAFEKAPEGALSFTLGRFAGRHPKLPSKIVTINPAPEPLDHFIGREYECQIIKKYIEENTGIVLVKGIGAIGKTEICKMLFSEYYSQAGEKIRYLGWVRYERNLGESLCQNFSLNSITNSSENRIDAIKDLINALADNLLLFIDDMFEVSEEDKSLLNSLNCNIVITSRLNELVNAKIVHVGELPLSDCVLIYKDITGQEDEDEVILQIAERTAQIPFVVKLFAKTARKIEATDDEMLDIIIRNQLSLNSRYLDGELNIDDHLEYIRQRLNELEIQKILFQKHSSSVNSAVYSDDQECVLSASGDNTICEWDRKTGACLHIFEGHSSFVRSVVYSNDGRCVLSASEDNTIREWDRETGACRCVFKGHSSYVRSAVYSADGRLVLSASKDNTIIEWDRETGACLRIYEGHGSSVRSAVYSTDGRCILSASGDKTIREWDRKTGVCLSVFKGHTAYVYNAVYSPDGQKVLSASGDKTIREWDRVTGACLRVFKGHSSAVNCALYSADGRYILSASKDKSIREWDREIGECLRIFEGHSSSVKSVVYSTDGRWILSASKDNTIREWDKENDLYMHTFERDRAEDNDFIISEKSFDDLMEPFHQAIFSFDYEMAQSYLPRLESADKERYESLMNELAFLFSPNKSLISNWNSKPVKYKVTLWGLLTDASTIEKQKDEKTIDDESNVKFEESIDKTATKASDGGKSKSPQEKGNDLEVSVLTLITKLFNVISADENERILLELRRQKAGFQFGFDIQFKYMDDSGVECICKLECKDKKDITLYDVSGKLEQMRMTKQKVNHWILITPNEKVANDLNDCLTLWENEGRWLPNIEKVQIWTMDNGVDELFALAPDVYSHYYPNGNLNPQEWDDKKRIEIAKEWKRRLSHANPLPLAWKKYLLDHQNLLTFSEQDTQIISEYNDLYKRRIKIKHLDESRNHLGAVEDYIIEWAHSTTSATIFLLGDFGDGKTFLTYSLSRRLSEEFIKSPSKGVLPLRLTLKDLTEQINVQDFLRLRLESFGSNLLEWNNIKRNLSVLIILDGFDEMSTGMDSKTINNNIRRLWDCVKSLRGVKFVISSRTTIFKSFKTPLTDRIKPYEILYLAPIEFQYKIDYLEKFARQNNVMDNYFKLCSTHDVLGLASKPIFLGMMETIMLSGSIEKLDNLSIYDKYTKIILERKPEIEHDFTNGEEAIDLPATADKLITLMEDFALVGLGKNGITFDDLKEELIEYRDNPSALVLWKNLTSPTLDDKEDSETRIINRSLLKDTPNGYMLCHRSMQEYFIAKWICRWLNKSPEKVEQRLSNIKLNIETISFIGRILSSLPTSETDRAKSCFIAMIEKTRNKLHENFEIINVGTSALTLYFRAWGELPNINWRNLVLDNAHLPEANFSNKDLSGTSFRYANLDNVNFTNSNLTDCDLTGVKFEETKDVCAMSFVSEEKLYLYVLYSDGKLRKWDIYSVQSNNYVEVATFDLKSPSHIYKSCFGFVFYQNNHMIFTNNADEIVKIQGGIHHSKDTMFMDFKEDKVLFFRSNLLSFYNLNRRKYIFKKDDISPQSKAIIIDDSSVIVYNDNDRVNILTLIGNELHEENLSRFLEERSFKNITTVAGVSNQKSIRICMANKNGEILLFGFDLNTINDNDTYLCDIASYQYGKYIKHICFLGSSQIAYTGTDGVIYVLALNEYNELQEINQWKLKIQCKRAIIDGVKQQEQYDKLRECCDF